MGVTVNILIAVSGKGGVQECAETAWRGYLCRPFLLFIKNNATIKYLTVHELVPPDRGTYIHFRAIQIPGHFRFYIHHSKTFIQINSGTFLRLLLSAQPFRTADKEQREADILHFPLNFVFTTDYGQQSFVRHGADLMRIAEHPSLSPVQQARAQQIFPTCSTGVHLADGGRSPITG